MFFAAKYDIAISTACPGLDYIVVETTNAAQACVELLRRENLGVATFMILVLMHATFYFLKHTVDFETYMYSFMLKNLLKERPHIHMLNV